MTAAGAINLFYFYANKLLDISQKILYTWKAVGDGGIRLKLYGWAHPKKRKKRLRAYTQIKEKKAWVQAWKLEPISLTDWNFFELISSECYSWILSLAIIVLAFVGASPQNIYSFVSAINIQMWLNILYNPIDRVCQ